MVSQDSPIPNVILEISGKRLGITAVVEDKKVIGCITDGDLRRMLEKHSEYSKLTAKEVMSLNPKTLTEDVLAVEALDLMKKRNITSIFVVDNQGLYLGVLHLHDIIKEGIY